MFSLRPLAGSRSCRARAYRKSYFSNWRRLDGTPGGLCYGITGYYFIFSTFFGLSSIQNFACYSPGFGFSMATSGTGGGAIVAVETYCRFFGFFDRQHPIIKYYYHSRTAQNSTEITLFNQSKFIPDNPHYNAVISQRVFMGLDDSLVNYFSADHMLTVKNCLLLFTVLLTCSGQSCNSGSYYDGTRCLSCNSACASCISPTVCTVCNTQAFLVINNGGLTCEWCSSLIDGCAICSSQSTCSVCIQGFIVSNGICETDTGAGGQVTLSSQITCQTYEVNINGACHPSIAFCNGYNPDATCSSCENGTLLIQGYCIPLGIASTGNTGSSPSPPASLVCQSRQYISNGECITMGPACLSFLINGTCTECDVGFTLFRGMCIQDAPNSQVLISYIPTTHAEAQSTNTSPSQDQNQNLQSDPSSQAPSCNTPCATCSSDPAYCLSCIDGYVGVDLMPGQCFQAS